MEVTEECVCALCNADATDGYTVRFARSTHRQLSPNVAYCYRCAQFVRSNPPEGACRIVMEPIGGGDTHLLLIPKYGRG